MLAIRRTIPSLLGALCVTAAATAANVSPANVSPGTVDLTLGPAVQSAALSTTVDITLTASTTSVTPVGVSAIDVILTWDPAELDFVLADASAYPWFVAGFLQDPDGINDSITDGEALYTMLAPAGSPAMLPPDIDAVFFRFTVLDSGTVSLAATSGTFGKTRVLGTEAGREITGDFSPVATVIAPSVNYCTAGTSFNGCTVLLSSTGIASASASSGFTVFGNGVEGAKNGTFFMGTNGQQANPWGNSSSFQCVVPPVSRAGLQTATGTSGLCDGVMARDLNALWCSTCPKPPKNPGAGAVVQVQLWYRDPFNTSNQTTTFSDALEFTVAP